MNLNILKNYLFFVIVILYSIIVIPAFSIGSASYSSIEIFSGDQVATIRDFFGLMGGRNFHTIIYGTSLQFISVIIIYPFLVILNFLGITPEFSFFIIYIKLFQYFVFIVGMYYLYKLILKRTNVNLAIIGTLFWLLSLGILRSLMVYKPDIAQFSFSVLCIYYLIEYHDECKNIIFSPSNTNYTKNYFLSSVFFGLAVGCKYTAPFLLAPYSLVFLEILLKNKTYKLKIIFSFILSILIAFIVFCIVSPQFVTSPIAFINKHLTLSAKYQYDLIPSIQAYFLPKLNNFISLQLGGPVYFIIYLGILIVNLSYMFIRIFVNKRIYITFIGIINSYIVAFMIFYFVFYSDSMNIFFGIRYFIPFIPFMLVVILTVLYRIKSLKKYPVYCTAFLLLLGQAVTCFGIIKFYGISTPAKIVHNDIFKQWIKEQKEDRKEIENSYIKQNIVNGGKFVILKKNVGNNIKNKLITTTFAAEKKSFIEYLLYCYNAEKENPGFLVRKWIAKNAKPHDTVLFEFYMDLLHIPNVYTPIDDLPKGIKLIRVTPQDMMVKHKYINKYSPDFIVTAKTGIAQMIKDDYPEYRLVKIISNEDKSFYILKK